MATQPVGSGGQEVVRKRLASVKDTSIKSLITVGDFGSSEMLGSLGPSGVKSALSSAERGRIADGLKVFSRLLASQPLVKIPSDVRAMGVSSSRWMLEGTSEEVMSSVQEMLDRVGGVRRLARDLVLGLIKGVAGFEIVWEDDPEESGRYILNLVEVPDTMWRWSRTRGLMIDMNGKDVDLPPAKFLVSHLAVNGKNPIIAAPLRPAAGYLVSAYYTFLSYAQYMERYAQPLVVGTYNEDYPSDSQEVSSFEAALAEFGAAGTITIPSSFDIKFAQHYSSPNETPFREQLRMITDQISRLIIGGTLSTDDSSKSGSYNMASIHAQVRGEIRKDDCLQVAKVINEQLIYPYVYFTFGETAEAPTLVPVIQEAADTAQVDVYKKLYDMGVRFDPAEMASDLGINPSIVAESGDGGAVQDGGGPGNG